MDKMLQHYHEKQQWMVVTLSRLIWSYLAVVFVKNLWFVNFVLKVPYPTDFFKVVFVLVAFTIIVGILFMENQVKWLLEVAILMVISLTFFEGIWLSSKGIWLCSDGLIFLMILLFFVWKLEQKNREDRIKLAAAVEEVKLDRLKAIQLNNELAGMYEELEVNDEEVRIQYQELQEHRDHLIMVQKRNALLFKASNEVIWELDLKTGIRHFAEENYVDEVALDLIQSTAFEDWAYDLHPEDQQLFVDAMKRVRNGEKSYDSFEIRVTDLKGGWKWLRSKVVSMLDEQGETIMMAGSYADIDDRKQKEWRIQHLAYFDQLTGLANRLNLIETIEKIIRREEMSLCSGVFYYIDMDEFGSVNNTFGHDVGDQLIIQIGQRLKNARNSDYIARLGSADFGILTEEKQFCLEPELLAQELMRILREPYTIDQKVIYLTASIGVNVFTDKVTSAEVVIRHGDIALRQAKKMGKNRYEVYQTKMSQEVSERILMANELRRSVERQELYLCFQPQIDMQNATLYGFEALVRWNSPVYGLVSPERFIPLAEETGLIIPMGIWIFKEACLFQKSLQANSPMEKGPKVSVNVATQQLEQDEFIQSVKAILLETGVEASQICIEVTESSVIESLETAKRHLEALRALKLQIALDDFGTGFSSLNHLNELPIDILKIDKSFTKRITEGSKERALIASIVSLSKSLRLDLIVEGIESKAQLELLRSIGCHLIQGYYFGKPMISPLAVAYFKNYRDEHQA